MIAGFFIMPVAECSGEQHKIFANFSLSLSLGNWNASGNSPV
jgi:hypothetical protein